MDALLVQVPCWVVNSPPYNLALLKAVCQKQGYIVSCLDLNIKFYQYLNSKQKAELYNNPTNWYSWEYVQQIIREHQKFIDKCVEEIIKVNARVIGFTTTGINSTFAKIIAQAIKENSPEKIIIFGGPYCFKTEFGQTLLREYPYIDAACYLEAEKALPALLNAIKTKGEITPFAGMSFRAKNREVVDCGDIEFVRDLDSVPFADYSDFPLEDYTDKELPISTSRGCINRCLFCSESKAWDTYRSRSAKNIFQEIKVQLSAYPFIKSFYFNDSLINGNINVLDELCDLLIENKLNISWGGQAAIREGMSKELIGKMKKAGFAHVSYGLESASPKILQKIGKRFTPELAETIIRHTKNAGIRTDVNIIVGFPEEEDEDTLATANFLKKNKRFIDEIFFHPLVVSKGSYYYEQRDKFGIKLPEEFNPNTWVIDNDDNTLSKRLHRLEFYQNYIGKKGKSFFDIPDYYLFIANALFTKEDYSAAVDYYEKVLYFSKNKEKYDFLQKKLQKARQMSLGLR